MKPMLWKELRQNLKWAFAVLAVMSVAAIYIVWLLSSPGRSMRFFGFMFYGWQNAPFDQLQVLSVLGCPLAGLVLGVLHVLPEKRQDLWAFLVHRPNSRTTIFSSSGSRRGTCASAGGIRNASVNRPPKPRRMGTPTPARPRNIRT